MQVTAAFRLFYSLNISFGQLEPITSAAWRAKWPDTLPLYNRSLSPTFVAERFYGKNFDLILLDNFHRLVINTDA